MSISIDREKLNISQLRHQTKSYGHLKTFAGHFFMSGWLVRVFTRDVFADVALDSESFACEGVNTSGAYNQIRSKYYWGGGAGTCYWWAPEEARATDDIPLYKSVNDVATRLGSEAIDVTAWRGYLRILEAVGSSIRMYSPSYPKTVGDYAPNLSASDMGLSPTISVTDTSITEGIAGIANQYQKYRASTITLPISYYPAGWIYEGHTIIRKPSGSLPLKPVAYFEMPIKGSGKLPMEDGEIIPTEPGDPRADPFRIELPEELYKVKKKEFPTSLQRKIKVLSLKGWTEKEISDFLSLDAYWETRNKLACDYGVLLPTDSKGKPTVNSAIVRVYDVHSTGKYPISKRIEKIKQLRYVRRLKRDEAIRMAMKIDDKIHIHDLLPCKKHPKSPHSKCCREYIEWREENLGVKRDLIDDELMASYVKGEKW